MIEKAQNLVKIGVTTNPVFRVRTLESQGGFLTQRAEKFGPFKNGYEVECEACKKLKPYRMIGEWFCTDFNSVVNIVSNIAKEIGNTDISCTSTMPDFKALFDYLCPISSECARILSMLKNEGFKVFTAENGTVWFEHDEYGLILPDLYFALMKSGEQLTGGADK